MISARCTWLSVAPTPPRKWDLRALDWHILPHFRVGAIDRSAQVIMDWRIGFRCTDWFDLRSKHRALVLGVETDEERAQLIRLGFGAVLHRDTPLGELAARLIAMRSAFDRRMQASSSMVRRRAPHREALDLSCTMTQAGPEVQPGISVAHEQYQPCHN